MARFVFAPPGFRLVCKRCGGPLEGLDSFSEDGQLDYPWCPKCIAFVDAKVIAIEVP